MSELTFDQKEKLMTDLRTVISDAEEMLKLAAGSVGESSVGLQERLLQRLAGAKASLLELQSSASGKVKAAGQAADNYVHDNPWRSVAIGAGIGLVVGLLIGRR